MCEEKEYGEMSTPVKPVVPIDKPVTFSQIPHYWPIFSVDFDSVYKSLWLGWWLIIWRVEPDWKLTHSWPIAEFIICFRPEG